MLVITTLGKYFFGFFTPLYVNHGILGYICYAKVDLSSDIPPLNLAPLRKLESSVIPLFNLSDLIMRNQLIPVTLLLAIFSFFSLRAADDPCYYDNIPPVAVCDAHTVVALGADGVAEVYAETIDDGSTDNCGIADYQIRRMMQGWCPPGYDDDTYFGPKTAFCCEDVGTVQWVVLKVIDFKGNSNTCMAEVIVQDNSSPNVTCPPDIYISCDFWFSEYDLYNSYSSVFGTIVPAGTQQKPIIINDPGNPTKPQPYQWGYDGVASCGGVCNGWGGQMPWISVVDVIDLRNSCGVGKIKRKFQVECGNYIEYCTQTIHVKDFYGGSYGITWPKDYTVDDCGANLDDYAPDLLPPPYNKPYVGSGGSCSLIGIAYEDLVFTFAEGACYKILREWTVIDWCKYDPHYPWSGGIWKHTQVIKITNHKPPVFHEPCDDVVVEGYENDCAGRYHRIYDVKDDCTPVHKLKYDYKIDLYANGSYDIKYEGTGAPTVDKVLPLGWHKILIYVEDQCGNTTTCAHKIHVVDKKKPTPVCYYGLSSVVMPIGGMVTIWAKDFDASSYDNCTPQSKLKFSFSADVYEKSRVFDCDDIGVVPIQIWVTDEYHNQQYCTTYIQIDDNEGACVGTHPISGLVTSFEGVGIPDASVDLFKIMPDQTLDSDETTSMTNELGQYLTGFGTTSYDRQLMVSRDGDPVAGLSTLDLVDLQRHVLGLEPFTEPQQFKAADLDGSGHVGVKDLLLLRNVLLGGITGEADLGWYFFDENCTWDHPQDILTGECAEGYHVDQDAEFPMPVNFHAVKMGDINNDLTNTAWHIETRSPVNYALYFDEDEEVSGLIHFRAGEDISSFGAQFSLPLPEGAFEVLDGTWAVDQNSMRFDVDRDLVNFAFAGQTVRELDENEILFSIRLDAQDPAMYADQVRDRLHDGLVPEIYNEMKEAIDLTIGMAPKDVNKQIDSYRLSVTPNPATHQSTFVIETPIENTGTLRVFNDVGEVVSEIALSVHPGTNRIAFDAAKLTAGVYYYSVQFDHYHGSGKLIKL